jgi:hypothetical protein
LVKLAPSLKAACKEPWPLKWALLGQGSPFASRANKPEQMKTLRTEDVFVLNFNLNIEFSFECNFTD